MHGHWLISFSQLNSKKEDTQNLPQHDIMYWKVRQYDITIKYENMLALWRSWSRWSIYIWSIYFVSIQERIDLTEMRLQVYKYMSIRIRRDWYPNILEDNSSRLSNPISLYDKDVSIGS